MWNIPAASGKIRVPLFCRFYKGFFSSQGGEQYLDDRRFSREQPGVVSEILHSQGRWHDDQLQGQPFLQGHKSVTLCPPLQQSPPWIAASPLSTRVLGTPSLSWTGFCLKNQLLVLIFTIWCRLCASSIIQKDKCDNWVLFLSDFHGILLHKVEIL